MNALVYTGQPCECPKCVGWYVVNKTVPREDLGVRIQYFHCRECGHVPEDSKAIIPLEAESKRLRLRQISIRRMNFRRR